MAQDGKVLLVANWKSNKTVSEVKSFFEGLKDFELDEAVEVVICPPFPYLKQADELKGGLSLKLSLGAQDVSDYPYGAYTGAVAVEMIKDFIEYAIVGHSERRKYFHETDNEVANKVSRLIENEVTPIVCVDEPYLESQINALEDEHKGECVYAYEPVSAIGSGKPDTPKHASSVAERIKVMTGPEVRVLYGGSVTAENIEEFTKMEHLDGALVGGASLEVGSWKSLIEASG